jgi:hypothetical protein
VQLLNLACRSRHRVVPNSTSLYAHGVFAVVVWSLLSLLSGCAGSVTPASSGEFSVSGSITPTSNGSGATVALSGLSSASTIANGAGNFTFTSLTNGNYTVTPNRAGYTFSPQVQRIAVDGASVSGVNFVASPLSTHAVQLRWNASTSVVGGYNVYRGTTSGGPYSKLNTSLVNALTYTDSGLAPSTTYYYVTTAVSSEGIESNDSNQASVQIP